MQFADPKSNIRELGMIEGKKVADLGAGSGHYTLAAARIVGARGVVYAVDIQRELLPLISTTARKEGFENVEAMWGDIDEKGGVPIAEGVVDAVILSNVLFQLEKKAVALKEALRILQPKGKLLIIDWRDSFGGIGPPRDAVVGEHEARKLCESTGFSVEKNFEAGTHHYGLVCKKP